MRNNKLKRSTMYWGLVLKRLEWYACEQWMDCHFYGVSFYYWCMCSGVTSDQVQPGHRGHGDKPLSAGGWPRKLNNIIQFNHSLFTQNKVWTEAREQLTLKRRHLNVMDFTCPAAVYTLSVPIVLIWQLNQLLKICLW